MNRLTIIIAITILSAVLTSSAKKNDYPRAEIKVTYSYPHMRLKTDAKAYDSEYSLVLLANRSYSKFYSPRTEYLDSLESTPSGKAISDRLLHEGIRKYLETKDNAAIPTRNGEMYIFKSVSDSTVTVYDRAGMSDDGFYTEALADMQWQIGDSTRIILDYECVEAETDYHGRHWTVWFSPEIPLPEGPWKLYGLPGLILEACDSSGQHRFIAQGIEISGQEIMPIYNRKKYDKMSRKDMLRGMRDFLTKGAPLVNAMIANTPAGERIEINSEYDDSGLDLHVDFLETDYHQ